MSFLIQRAAGRSLTLTQVNVDVLRIGRGTNQDLRSENPAVALEHAIIEHDAAGYVVTDKGSITGTYVNRKPVESARLSKGDVLEIGDLRIDVQLSDPTKPLFLRITVERAAAVAMPEEEEESGAAVVKAEANAPVRRVIKSRKFDYVGAYRLHRPWLTKVSLSALLLIVALGVIGEVIRPEKQKAFMPGGLSSAHARAQDRDGHAVADNCAACHLPFKGVSSAKCLDCHPQQPHAQHDLNAPDCFSCHAEHRGATKLSAIPDTTCVGCHSDLTKRVSLPANLLAALRFADDRYAFEDIARINAFGDKHPELAYPRDANTLRFDHKLHLGAKGVFDAQGKRRVLECKSCHDAGAGEPKPVTFAQHCHDCHRLGFDTRFPDDEVPHGGDAGIVYGYIAARYSNDRDIIGKPPAEVRRILTARKRVDVDERAVTLGIKVFNIRCRFCHEVKPRGDRLVVTPPVIPTRWFVNAKFSHERHRLTSCETCHAGARESASTADVSMPRRELCARCHAADPKRAQAASACLTCHEYHFHAQGQVSQASLARAGMGGLGGGGRMLQGILLAVIVVLLLVVLVPVGIALFRRLLPEKTPPPPPEKRVPPPPPPASRPPSIDIPTDKVARQPVPPPPPTPVPAANATPDTAVHPLIDRTSVPQGAGTEMMMWNGMLHCTAGALEGQRFIIEDDGFYMGRDPALAKVVVPDTRVSKRHLRIVPRDGKVWAIDQSSTNGTFINGTRITEAALKRGDTIVLGDNAATFVYQI